MRHLSSVPARVVTVLICAAALSAPVRAADGPYGWQQEHVRVTPSGDFEWAPRPFAFEPGEQVRYIDFERGDDLNPGTREEPWKRHPWDPKAEHDLPPMLGATTFVFRRGVVYRGTIEVAESGRPDEPIRLTSDPDWGEGEAVILSSERITGWRRLSPEQAPAGMPEPEAVWYADIGTDFFPRAVWMVDEEGEITRIHLARTPNWEPVDLDDVKSQWREWQAVERVEAEDVSGVRVWAEDPDHLAGLEPGALDGATVWSEYTGVMGTPYPSPVEGYDPARGAVRFGGPWGGNERYAPGQYSRYYLENLPRFLDTGGEYWYDAAVAHPRRLGIQPPPPENPGRLYIRLPGDRDPNTVRVEVGRHASTIDIRDRRNVHVTGLTFHFGNPIHWFDRWWTLPGRDAATIRILGSARDIRISHCRFEHVIRPICAEVRQAGDRMDDLLVTDNDFRFTDYGAVNIGRAWPGDGVGVPQLGRVAVLRNRMADIGLRPARARHGHALTVGFAEVQHVAGNILERLWGAGVFLFGGKPSGRSGEAPFTRMVVHQNKVIDSMLNTNDWGSIETWQGGPAYVFNNIVGNPGGYWHRNHIQALDRPVEERSHTTARFGFAYYMDGAFKQYYFNNIARGKSNDLTSPLANTSAFMEIIGFQNTVFNNTAFRFATGSRRQAPQVARNSYLGNLWIDLSDWVFWHGRPQDDAPPANVADEGEQADFFQYDQMAYARNVFQDLPRDFAVFEHTGYRHKTIESFHEALRIRGALADEVGVIAEVPVVRDAEAHDFRLAPDSPARDQGVRVFVPWGLYASAGEWHFRRNNRDHTLVWDEHWNMTDDYRQRQTYRYTPRYHLRAVNVAPEAFTESPLDDWATSAIRLNGRDQYLLLRDEALKNPQPLEGGQERIELGDQQQTADITTGNFLIEIYFRTKPGTTGVLVSKIGPQAGYELSLRDDGRPGLMVRADDGSEVAAFTDVQVHDGRWHHLIAEMEREALDGLRLYLDGRRVPVRLHGEPPARRASLSSESDLYVGRDQQGSGYFAGEVAFLRICRGTLADARTTIEELYAWQFDGPQFRDFFGRSPVGRRRDAGAIEFAP